MLLLGINAALLEYETTLDDLYARYGSEELADLFSEDQLREGYALHFADNLRVLDADQALQGGAEQRLLARAVPTGALRHRGALFVRPLRGPPPQATGVGADQALPVVRLFVEAPQLIADSV